MVELSEVTSKASAAEVGKKYGFEVLNEVLLEVSQLIRIHRAYGDIAPECIEERLLEIASGPFSVSDENSSSSNRPRNIAFELDLLSSFYLGGGMLSFRGLADITCEYQGLEFIVECKRPMSEGGVARRIKSALNQLQRRLDSDDSLVYGLIGMHISKAFWPVRAVVEVSDRRQLESTMDQIFLGFDKEYSKSWVGRDERIPGLLAQHTFTAITNEGSQYNTGHYTAVVSGARRWTHQFNDLLRIRQMCMAGLKRQLA